MTYKIMRVKSSAYNSRRRKYVKGNRQIVCRIQWGSEMKHDMVKTFPMIWIKTSVLSAPSFIINPLAQHVENTSSGYVFDRFFGKEKKQTWKLMSTLFYQRTVFQRNVLCHSAVLLKHIFFSPFHLLLSQVVIKFAKVKKAGFQLLSLLQTRF